MHPWLFTKLICIRNKKPSGRAVTEGGKEQDGDEGDVECAGCISSYKSPPSER